MYIVVIVIVTFGQMDGSIDRFSSIARLAGHELPIWLKKRATGNIFIN